MQDNANSRAIVEAIKFFAALIIIAAIAYSEILFLGIVGSLFPAGPLAIGAIVGAITTGLSILALCLAKSHWFRPGMQLIVAWAFTLLEVAVLIMNDILAYELHTGQQLDQYTQLWRTFCVAAPALSLIGWILLFYFSPERAIVHKRMEMEDNQKAAQIDFEKLMHDKAMAVQRQAANMVGSRLEAKIEGHMEYQLDRAAARFAARIASELTGEHVSSEDLSGDTRQIKVVDAEPPKRLAASRDHAVDPHHVKEQVDNEKKSIEKKPLIDFSLPKGVDKKKIETELASPDEELEEEQQVEEEEQDTPQTETDLMAMDIDDRWREYSSMETSQPQKKRGRKKVKQED